MVPSHNSSFLLLLRSKRLVLLILLRLLHHFQPSDQDDDSMGDPLTSIGVTKEMAVAVKESSLPVKKRIGQRTPSRRESSGPPHDSLFGNVQK